MEGHDQIGYLYASQRLVEVRRPSYHDDNNQLAGPYFSPYAFQVRRPGDPDFYLGFSIGFPLLLALAQSLFKTPHVAFYVAPFFGILGIFATFVLGALLFNFQVGIVAAMLLAATPTYVFFSTDAWSGVPSLTFILWGLVLYLYAQRYRGRLRFGVSLLGGLLLGYACFIRYSAMTIWLPILAYALYARRWKAFKDPADCGLFVALTLTATTILLYNRYYYGGFLTTAYSPQHGWYPWPAFDWRYALGSSPVGGRSLVEGAKTILRNYQVLLLWGAIGLLAMPRPQAILITGISLVILTFYGFYAFAPTGINARFLLPILPMVSLVISHGIVYLFQRKVATGLLAVICVSLILALIIYPAYQTLIEVRQRNKTAESLVQYVQEFVNGTEGNAVFLSYAYNDLIIFHGQRSALNYRRIPTADPRLGRYRVEELEPGLVEAIDVLLLHDIPVYYVKDLSPSFWNSLEILRSNYELTLYREEPEIYRIRLRDKDATLRLPRAKPV